MADKPKTNEEEPTSGVPSGVPMKKKSNSLILVITLIIGLAIGGGGGYFMLSRNAAKAKAAAQKSKMKELARSQGEGEEPEGQADDKGKKAQDDSKSDKLAAILPEDEEVKRVIEVPPFILNLADQDEGRFLRLTLSIGVGEEGSDKADPVYLTRVRNAVLAILMTKTSNDILSAQGKISLRRELLTAIKVAVKEPPVVAVYIIEMLVQR